MNLMVIETQEDRVEDGMGRKMAGGLIPLINNRLNSIKRR